MTQMVSLKNPPPKKESKKDMPCCGPMNDMYPYSTRMELDNDLVKKFDCMGECNVGDQVSVKAVGTITSVNEDQRKGTSDKKATSNRRVTIQFTNMSIEPDDDGAMKSGFDEGSKEEEA